MSAHNALSDIYQHALQVLGQDQMDPVQIKFHLSAIKGDAIPLLLAVEHNYMSTDLKVWLVTVAMQFQEAFITLSCCFENIKNQ